MGGTVTVSDRPGGGSRFVFKAAFDAAPDAMPRAGSLDQISVAVRSPDAFVRAAAGAQIAASGGSVRDDSPVTLIDHAEVLGTGLPLACAPATGRALVLLRPSERDLIARYRAAGFHGYLIKPLRRASLVERVRAATAVCADVAAGAPLALSPEDDRVVPVRFAGTRVLLAEDNPVGALLARTLLRREGCVVETAATGGEAVAACKRARYDLIFMDMRMPGMDGAAATRLIRAAGDRTPIVALTANAFAEDRRACLEAGMDDHLTKPLEPEALRAALTHWTTGDFRAKVADA
jgi:CheY-like chemotaxis protein